jgi:hypothetical protein
MKRRGLLVGAGLAVLVAGLGVGYRSYRGPTGVQAEGIAAPEFTSLDASRWENGEPVSLASAKGDVVFVEGWSPG